MSQSEKPSPPIGPDFNCFRDHYAIFRDYMKHEDDLINQRTTWHCVIQGLLLTAFGWLLQWKIDSSVPDQMQSVRATMSIVLPIAGILVAALGFLSCWAADIAIRKLFSDWQRVVSDYPDRLPRLPGIAGAGSNLAKNLGKLPSLVIPGLMLIMWLLIFAFVCKDHPFSNAAIPSASARQLSRTIDEEIKDIEETLDRLDELETRMHKGRYALQQPAINANGATSSHAPSHP
jgi:hypothetical protein